ncbi:retrovirus-related Pol polyprotein from transposon RE1 [Nephila pilipes]|uniref:Retrovirus-related Pol polyprotein from transposon RE1 n=1 Tax=Nephila pilipes TaxID=299642 RepID=A0A8X6J453_NEPPI|nr:retrovirus-related Pol polyprotein from transposon RE1 [Nephila pilipes]
MDGNILREKAFEIAASNGWISRFKIRHGDDDNPDEKWLHVVDDMSGVKFSDYISIYQDVVTCGILSIKKMCDVGKKISIRDGNTMQYKVRLVSKGYNQKIGTDCDETFATVVKHTTIKAFLTVAVYKRMHVKHIYMKTAFLHRDLHEDSYVKQPEGYITLNEEQKVYKLKKSLYGLKQAAEAWNQKIAEVLQFNNFQQSAADNCLFTKEEKGKI